MELKYRPWKFRRNRKYELRYFKFDYMSDYHFQTRRGLLIQSRKA
jgi:hypothetical protein